ncbi:uncharacterized protein EAF02_006639 [Botrytis sinoallii]|uniref:uncharacterized protein n=1 Tax=Botrytis sinoallii TaxID=1463999 RepID=UPI0019024112|nr:uncharacterized protein EAF02_006639 [Botrytis sinoallii]KAF7881951.1 hypothetical protein EAF02_006639 [Botrytis sinoallii]
MSEPFDKERHCLTPELIRMHVNQKKIQWKQPQCIKRSPWLSEVALKGEFGEIGLEALHESILRLRHLTGSDTDEWRKRVEKCEGILQKHIQQAADHIEFLHHEEKAARRKEKASRKRLREKEEEKAAPMQLKAQSKRSREEETEKAAQRKKEAQSERFWREEKEIREQYFRRGVKELGYTKDAESPEDLSWTDPNASGFHHPEPESHSNVGAFRPGVQDVYLNSPHRLTTTSTAQGQVQGLNASSASHLSQYSRNSSPQFTPMSSP